MRWCSSTSKLRMTCAHGGAAFSSANRWESWSGLVISEASAEDGIGRSQNEEKLTIHNEQFQIANCKSKLFSPSPRTGTKGKVNGYNIRPPADHGGPCDG